jgi:hypothetical protein
MPFALCINTHDLRLNKSVFSWTFCQLLTEKPNGMKVVLAVVVVVVAAVAAVVVVAAVDIVPAVGATDVVAVFTAAKFGLT